MDKSQARDLADLFLELATACAYHDGESKYDARDHIVDKLLEIFPAEDM